MCRPGRRLLGCLTLLARPDWARAVWCRRMLFALRSAVLLRTVLDVGVAPPNNLCLVRASAIRQFGAAAAGAAARLALPEIYIVRRCYISSTTHGRSIKRSTATPGARK